jgi:hypothetical protein
MQKNCASQSGIFTPRVLVAFMLCSFGVLLGVFSLAAMPPVDTTRAHTSLRHDRANVSGRMPFASTTSDWSIVSSPNPSLVSHDFLLSVSCVLATDCWAVGYYQVGTAAQTLIEHWDGTSWAIVTSPNSSVAQQNFLYGVTCVSASDCWAIGYYSSGTTTSAFQTLIERWDGTAWAIVPSPNTATTHDNILYSVTCVSASQCWAVGYYSNDNFYAQTLIERWDGTSWTIVNSPSVSATQANLLNGVTCASSSSCWAVGFIYTNGGVTFQTLIEHWDGTAWTIVNSPNTSTEETNALYGVTCVSASNCWSVGYYINANGSYQTLIERWNGTSWTIVTSPNISTTQRNSLAVITCVSASECWAVGHYVNAAASFQTLIERWDGISWTIVNSPNTSSTEFNLLNGVTCLSASECWAVGYSSDGNTYQTLTEHYVASPSPIPASVVSRKTHSGAGTFEVNLPITGDPGIECRSGGANDDYQILVTFPNAVTFNNAAVTSGTGTISSSTGSGTTALTVNLTGVTNAQTITLTLSGVNDGTNTGDVGIRMGVLVGDVSANAIVSNTDVAAVKSQVAAPVTASNFRNDVNANGIISNTDVSATKAQVGTSLP